MIKEYKVILMRGKSVFYFFLITTIFGFTINAFAESLRVELSPKKIKQGDAFFIKVTGAKTVSPPSASLARKKLYFSNCGEGCFIAIGAIDIKTKPGVYMLKMKAGKKKRNLKLSVKKTAFSKLKLTLPDDKVFLSPDDLDIVNNEQERLQSLFRGVSEKQWDGAFIPPLENDISTRFGTKRIMNRKWISVHKGIDIKGQEGEEIRASNNGMVVLAEELFFGGNTVIIDHGQGIHTIYMHLSKTNVKPEDTVSKGDVIGLVGSSGRSIGPHLHFGVKVQGINTNPLSLLKLEL